MPTGVFYLLAAWYFSKSHPERAERLYKHAKHCDHRAISRKGQMLTMNASVPFTWLVAGFPIAFIPPGVLAVLGP